MRLDLCARIAFRNLFRKRKYTAALFFGVFFVMVMMTFWFVFRKGINDMYQDFLRGKVSDCYYFLDISLNEDGTPEKDENYQLLEKLRQMPECGDRIITTNEPDIVAHIRKEDDWSRINIGFVTMEVDGAEYKGVNDYSYDFEEPIISGVPKNQYPVIFKAAFLGEPNFVTENDIAEFSYRYQEPVMLCGKDTVDFGEIIISDYYLDKFGIPKSEYENLIGKKVTFSAGGEVILSDVVLTGIVDSRVFRMQRFAERKLFGAQLLYHAKPQELADWGLWYMTVVVPIREYGKILSVYEKLNDTGLVDNWVKWNNSGLQAYQSLNTAKVIVDRVFVMFAILIILAVLLYLVNTLWQNIEARASYCGMLKAIGMRPAEIGCILFAEIVIVAIPCMLISVPLSVWTFDTFSKVMEGVFTVTVKAGIGDAFRIAGLVAGAVVLLVFSAELPMAMKVVKQEPAVLLAEDESK